jgi:hypothetical protein
VRCWFGSFGSVFLVSCSGALWSQLCELVPLMVVLALRVESAPDVQKTKIFAKNKRRNLPTGAVWLRSMGLHCCSFSFAVTVTFLCNYWLRSASSMLSLLRFQWSVIVFFNLGLLAFTRGCGWRSSIVITSGVWIQALRWDRSRRTTGCWRWNELLKKHTNDSGSHVADPGETVASS